MSFSIERYKEESKKVDTAGIDWDAVKQAADANLVTSLSMVLPFGPAEKQALLEAADSTARAKLLIAFLEMNAFGQSSENPPGRTN